MKKVSVTRDLERGEAKSEQTGLGLSNNWEDTFLRKGFKTGNLIYECN